MANQNGEQHNATGITLEEGRDPSDTPFINYMQVRDLTEKIPKFSGDERFVDFLGFEMAIQNCYHRVNPKNGDFICLVLEKIYFPARALLEAKVVHSSDEILEISRKKYMINYGLSYFEEKFGNMYMLDFEEIDDFNLRLQKVLKYAKASFKVIYPQDHEPLSRMIEEKALKIFKRFLPADYRVALGRQPMSLEDELNRVLPLLEDDCTS